MFDSGYRRSPADHRDYSYTARVQPQTAELRRLPASWQVDRRTPLPVYDQGSVPSCMGWSVATAQTALERFDKRRTVRHDGLEFYGHIALPGGGAYPRDALRLWSQRGVLTEAGRPHRIAGYAAVNPRDHDAVRHAMHTGRGLLIGFGVTREWAQGGGREFDAQPGAELLGGHAMFCTGWTPAGVVGLNTWGEAWGQRGRGLLPWAYWDQHVWECWSILDVND